MFCLLSVHSLEQYTILYTTYHGNYINGKSGFESKSVRILPFLSYVQYNLKILPEVRPLVARVAEILHSFID